MAKTPKIKDDAAVTESADGPKEAPTPAGHTEGDADAVKAKMREALEKKKSHQHGGSSGGTGKVKGPNTAGAGQQRRVFRRKSG